MSVESIDVRRTLAKIPTADIEHMVVVTRDINGKVKAYSTFPDSAIGNMETAQALWVAYETYEPDVEVSE